MIGNLLSPELKELIQQRDFTQLREILCDFPPADIAEIFYDLHPGDEAVLLRLLPRELAAEVFEYLPIEDQERTLHALGSEQVAQILNDIAPDDRTALLEELPAAVTQKLLASAESRRAQDRHGAAGLSRTFHRPPHDAGICRRAAELDGRGSVRAFAPRRITSARR